MCRYHYLSLFGIFTINIFAQPIIVSPQLSGGNLVWQDEFEADTVNYKEWEHDIGTGSPVFEEFGNSSPEFSPEGFPKDNFSVQWDGTVSYTHLTLPTSDLV